MSTLQSTTGLRDRIGSRLGTIALALSVLCAIGVAVLILVPSRHHAHKPTATVSAHAPAAPISAAHAPSAPVASIAVAAPAPAGYFRDPATHALLRVRTTDSGGPPLPANHTLGRVIR
ncbi:MAG TPA: hypothetical protein VMB27_05660 [Solirubrobacteraceae bacterium]|nr:hypothetical protein [Solirubrobacteraceae bacterium]